MPLIDPPSSSPAPAWRRWAVGLLLAAAVLPALSTDLFGFPHAGVNYGFLALGQSVGSLAFPFAANFFGLEAGRHWMAVAAAGAGFACIRALRPVEPSDGRGQQGMDRTC